jgi:hypothetical protein
MITGSTEQKCHCCPMFCTRNIVRYYLLDDLKGAEARFSKDLTLCQAKVNEFQISETKFESLCDESITTIKKREKQLFLSYVLYTEYCPLLFSVVHLEIAI